MNLSALVTPDNLPAKRSILPWKTYLETSHEAPTRYTRYILGMPQKVGLLNNALVLPDILKVGQVAILLLK